MPCYHPGWVSLRYNHTLTFMTKENLEKKALAYFMRKDELTKAEAMLWANIKNKKLGYKFRRQVVIDGFIVDFYCPKEHLAIELDGQHHFDYRNNDPFRDKVLRKRGIRVLHIENKFLFTDTMTVLEAIRMECQVPWSMIKKWEE